MKRVLSLLLAAVSATALVVVGIADPAAASTPANGYYMLVNDKSGRCLDQDYSGGTQHRDVLGWTCAVGSTNQHWRKVDVSGGGGWFQLINEKSGKCLN